MTHNTTYKIKFLDNVGNILETLSFDSEAQRDDIYDTIDTINWHLVPANAVRVEKEKVERLPVTPVYRQRRRSIISGRYKGGAY